MIVKIIKITQNYNVYSSELKLTIDYYCQKIKWVQQIQSSLNWKKQFSFFCCCSNIAFSKQSRNWLKIQK